MEPDFDSLEALAAELEASEEWPPKREQAVRAQIHLWQAFYTANSDYLKNHCNWRRKFEYVCDALAKRLSDAIADLIFGADPQISAAGHGETELDETTGEEIVSESPDQELMMDLVEENALPSELQRAAGIASSEGEVWWRWMIDDEQSFVPVLEWHSRLDCIPLFEGREPIAVAFVSELVAYGNGEDKKETVWRLIEYQARGVIQNVLYKGTSTLLGSEAELDEHPATLELADATEDGIWIHGLDHMICGRVVNGFGKGHYCGKSDYEAVKDMLFALNEASSIAQKNVELTARKRVIIPDTYLDRRGRPPLDDDVIISSEAHRDPDKPDQGFHELEWSFEADQLILYTRDLIGKITTRVGLTAHIVDANADDGLATSGTAYRIRMIPASNTARGKGRWWDDGLPKILMVGAMLDALPEEDGGNGRPWQDPELLPTVERGDPFPRDQIEDATMIVQLQSSKLVSKRTSLEILFPDWTEERRKQELQRLADEEAVAIEQQQALFGAPGGFTSPDEVPLEQ